MKRIVQALQENIQRYEDEFGIIQMSEVSMGDITLQ
jgi:hypothetical protein